MNKKYFEKVSLLALSSLLLLSVVQGVWVWSMYKDSVFDFTRRVESATYKSIHKAFRMDAVPGLTFAEQINIDLDSFVFYFEPNLLELDAFQPYQVEVIDKELGNTLMKRAKQQNIKNPKIIEIDIDDDAIFALRLSIQTPFGVFIKRMWGLILSSVAIIVLLAAVLIYILKTMFKQRTLEQMRRDFTHNITHELKTPISVAVAATDALRNFSADTDPVRRSRYLEIVEQQLVQLTEMVERILSVSVDGRKESFNPTSFSVKELLEEVGADVLINNTKHIEFTVCMSQDIELFADRFHIKSMLATLVDNSIKYSKESLKLVITAEQKFGHTIISVADNGIGIKAVHLQHIFEKFYRVPTGDMQNTRGYGLGLYYACRVVLMHNGEIFAESKEGKGTTITINLPDNGEKNRDSAC